ncbi:MAG: MEKHLA domain-containing protein [Pseudomonadota bacterium]|nr:MEKHLA domain-containing protein [Pseudomonadota bacterium]
MQEPSVDNHFQAQHAELLLSSFLGFTGMPLVQEETAEAVYQAPFPILSHTTDNDPILNYGNLTAQNLFEMPWAKFTQMPSRLTAEPGLREKRASMFDRMRKIGWINDYEGIRISASGKRFRMRAGIIWTITDANGNRVGEAATFKDITPL